MGQPPQDQAGPDQTGVPLVRVWNHGEAVIVRQLLASYGIPCQVVSQVSRTFSMEGLGEIRILVPRTWLARARKLLAEHRRQGLRVIRGGKAAEGRRGEATSGRGGG